jgi:3-oxoadipate enol-lactonase
MKTTINSISLNVIERGLPIGIPVVFIHGFPFSHEMWNLQMHALPQNVRAIAYDVRGHGLSDVGDGQYTIELFVDDLIGLLDHLGISKAILCGLSMGGYIALRAMERFPQRIAGLILCDTKSEADTDIAKINRSATLSLIKRSGVQSFTDDFLKRIFWNNTFENNPQAIQFIRNIIEANSPLGICGTLLALASRTDTTALLPSINIPTCIIVGEQDTLTPPSTSQKMHELISDSEYHIIPKAAHMSNIENPSIFNEILLAFLKKHW